MRTYMYRYNRTRAKASRSLEWTPIHTATLFSVIPERNLGAFTDTLGHPWSLENEYQELMWVTFASVFGLKGESTYRACF